MPSLEEGIVTALRADATVGPLVTNGDGTYRIHHELMPQRVEYPAIVYARESTQSYQTLDGPSTLKQVRISLDCYGVSSASMKSLAAAVKGVLDGVKDAIGGVSIQSGYCDTETDLSQYEGDDDDRRVALEFVFWLNE